MRGEHNHFIDQKGASFRLLIVIRLKFNKMLFFLSYKHFFLLPLSATFDFQACKAREQNKNHVKMAKKNDCLLIRK